VVEIDAFVCEDIYIYFLGVGGGGSGAFAEFGSVDAVGGSEEVREDLDGDLFGRKFSV